MTGSSTQSIPTAPSATTPSPTTPSATAGARAARAISPALVIAGMLLVAGNLRAGITTVGPLLGEVQHDLGLPSVVASVLISLPLLAFAVVSPLAPRIARHLGLERSLALGLLVLAVGLVVRSLPGLPLLWVGTGLLGVAIAVLNVVLPALVKRDFPRRIGQITGVYSAVQAGFAAIAAGVAVPVAGASAIGWRLPWAMWAGLALIGFAVLVPQLRRRTVVPSGEDDIAVDAPEAVRWRSPWTTALGWQITAFMGLQSVGFYVLITWLPSIERAAGIPSAEAGVHQLVLNAAGIAGSLGVSALIPRLRDQRIITPLAPLFFIVGIAGFLFAPQLAVVWAAIAGISGGAAIVLALSFFGLRTRHHSQAAALSGMAQSVGYLLAAAGPILAGAWHDATGSWTPTIIALICSEAVLAVLGYLAGRDRTLD
jgi:MFS transporter, CP family, cyanate transporter